MTTRALIRLAWISTAALTVTSVAVLWAAFSDHARGTEVRPEASIDVAAAPAPSTEVNRELFVKALDRGVFRALREAAPPPVPQAPAQPAAAQPTVRLIATFVETGSPQALVMVGEKRTRVSIGDVVAGSTIAEIHPESIVLSRDGEKSTLPFRKQATTPPNTRIR